MASTDRFKHSRGDTFLYLTADGDTLFFRIGLDNWQSTPLAVGISASSSFADRASMFRSGSNRRRRQELPARPGRHGGCHFCARRHDAVGP